MSERLRYPELAPEGIASLRGLEHYLNATTALPAVLLELVRLRASLLNGCSFCVGHHRQELKKHNEPETRIEAVRDWEPSQAFTPRERAALAWTDAVTNIQGSHASDAEYEAVSAFFHEKDLVDLTLAIAGINAWNRMSIAFAVQWDPSRGRKTKDVGAGQFMASGAASAESGLAGEQAEAQVTPPRTEPQARRGRPHLRTGMRRRGTLLMTTAARWPRISLHPSTPSSRPGSRTETATSLPALRAEGLSKSYPVRLGGVAGGDGELQLFRDLAFEVGTGELIAIIGRSGAGKSSLLHLLAGLDRPTGGQVWIGDQELTRLSANDAARVRNRAIGFVWQFHYLLPEFTALENVALPLLARGWRRPDALAKAREWLRVVELETRAEHRSGELSGGEQGRVALARALVTEPRVLLADEPTGDLDDVTADHLFGVLERVCRDRGLGVVLVTHNVELARRCERVLRLHEGRLLVA